MYTDNESSMDIPVDVRLLFVSRIGSPAHVMCTNLAHIRAVRQMNVAHVWKVVMVENGMETTLLEWLGISDAMRTLNFLQGETKRGKKTVRLCTEEEYAMARDKRIKILVH